MWDPDPTSHFSKLDLLCGEVRNAVQKETLGCIEIKTQSSVRWGCNPFLRLWKREA